MSTSLSADTQPTPVQNERASMLSAARHKGRRTGAAPLPPKQPCSLPEVCNTHLWMCLLLCIGSRRKFPGLEGSDVYVQ